MPNCTTCDVARWRAIPVARRGGWSEVTTTSGFSSIVMLDRLSRSTSDLSPLIQRSSGGRDVVLDLRQAGAASASPGQANSQALPDEMSAAETPADRHRRRSPRKRGH